MHTYIHTYPYVGLKPAPAVDDLPYSAELAALREAWGPLCRAGLLFTQSLESVSMLEWFDAAHQQHHHVLPSAGGRGSGGGAEAHAPRLVSRSVLMNARSVQKARQKIPRSTAWKKSSVVSWLRFKACLPACLLFVCLIHSFIHEKGANNHVLSFRASHKC